MQCDSTTKSLSGRSQALKTATAELKDWEAKASELQKQVGALHCALYRYLPPSSVLPKFMSCRGNSRG